MILFIMWVRWTLAAVSLRPAHGPGLEVADSAGALEPGRHGGDRSVDPQLIMGATWNKCEPTIPS